MIFTQGRPMCSALALDGRRRIIGRDKLGNAVPPDPNMSRRHAQVRWDGQRFMVRDLGSRNGTYVDGHRIRGSGEITAQRYLRAGTSLILLSRDVHPFRSCGIECIDGLILGPALAPAWQTIGHLARSGSNVFLHGESGTGKERAVRAFHAMGTRSARPLVSLNCSSIPKTVAERLLFGTRRGVYSGATADAVGYVQTADGGVLFLDEVAELDLEVQAKLLRVLESGEVMALGDNRARKVDFQLCVATHKNLREEVAHGRFRQDLCFRINSPAVCLPPLRERIEEIPWLVKLAVDKAGKDRLLIAPSFIEACLERPWPGNVRELLSETGAAVHRAIAQDSKSLDDTHLAPDAGQDIQPAAQPANGDSGRSGNGRSGNSSGPGNGRSGRRRAVPDRNVLETLLAEHDGNVSATARTLGVHRNQLRRWLTSLGIKRSKSPP